MIMGVIGDVGPGNEYNRTKPEVEVNLVLLMFS